MNDLTLRNCYRTTHPRTHTQLIFAFIRFEGLTRYKLPQKAEKMGQFMGTRTIYKKNTMENTRERE